MTTVIIFVAMLLLLPVGTVLSKAWPLGKKLSSWKGERVRVDIFGQTYPGDVIDFVLTLGPGVNLRVSGHQMKIAQPSGISIGEDEIEVAAARYVQWDKQRRHPSGDYSGPAVRIVRA